MSNNKLEQKSDKGYWEYSIFQKIIIPNEEQNIKKILNPTNTFDLKKINIYIDPTIKSREEQLEEKVNTGITLSNKDNIIYTKYINDKKEKLENDLKEIAQLGVKAEVKTDEGKVYYMMYLLDLFIKKNQIENIANLYLKLKNNKYVITDAIKSKYNIQINKMNEIINNLDLIELQFTKFYNQMPPLNQKGFNKLDEWQLKTIENINNNISSLICAPTSAGKSVISGYAITKGRILYIVPTDALAWQIAAYIGNILNSDIPILTLTYQSDPRREELIKLLNNSKGIVGTPEIILDYLPFINCDFKWVIMDEIHMIGKKEGGAIESIIKILKNISFLGLSATIGNINDLKDWLSDITKNNNIDLIVCNKRFFNLQKYYYDNLTREFILLNPLSLINISEIEDKSILNKTLNPTPQDAWSLVSNLLKYQINLGDLHPNNYFKNNELIELDQAYEYYNNLIKFMVNNYNQYENEIIDIMRDYNIIDINNSNNNLVKILEDLRNNNKFPAIIFEQNTICCLEIIKKLAEDLENCENIKYPDLKKDRLNKNKNNKRLNKKIEKELNSLSEKQLEKKLKENKDCVFELKQEEDITAPHEDFIFNKNDKFSDYEIKEWANKYKIYFECINGDYHYLIRLLWRGIGVYVNGLPDSYLRLIQRLASNKKLAVVFSDNSLVFGISMPFRTVVIYKCELSSNDLDSMIYHQQIGRAGRRGLDKEGNVIFVGYSCDKIKELSTSSIPNIKGYNRLIWTNKHVYNYTNNNNYLNLNDKLLLNTFSETEINNFNLSLNNNLDNIWKDTLQKDKNIVQLLWLYRYSNEAFIIYNLLPYLKKYFENCNPNEENKQIEIAYFLSKFIDIRITNNNDHKLINYNGTTKIDYNSIYESNYIEINNNIDGRIWLSIRNNSLYDINDNTLRENLFNFSTKLKPLQHYMYHTKQINLTKLLAKLLTRIWWIYHTSSPINK